MENKKERFRAWCFTLHDYTSQEYEQLANLPTVYKIIGKEICPETKRPHLQGYLYFKDGKTFSSLKKQSSSRIHLEIAKGSPQENRDYCRKEGDYVEIGDFPKQGKRSDLDNVREQLEETNSMRTIVKTAHSMQSVKFAETYLKYHEKSRRHKTVIKWFWGPTASGKTRSAYEELDNGDLYTTMSNMKWFDGYDAHENVIIDDFRDTQLKFADWLRLTDRYEYRVETKGGTRQFLARNIIFTCPFHPAEMYLDETRENRDQFIRRIDEIREFKYETEYNPDCDEIGF